MQNIGKKLLMLGVLVTLWGCAQEKSHDELTPEKIIDNFYEHYQNNGIDKALNSLFLTNKWLNINDSSIVSLKAQLTATINLLGSYQGYEQITKKGIGNNYLLFSYFTKYERQPLRFTFIFYKINGAWQLQNFLYDDNYDTELEKAAEVYFLKENYIE
jgi:hypothetical protein